MGHPCERECLPGVFMKCEYNFTMEWYTTMSKACFDCPYNKSDCFRRDCIAADGFERPVTVINRQLPGPIVSVCEGDTVIVTLKNHLTNGEGTALHWHGQFQKDTPWMDGVPMLTQCAIPSMNSHQYKFKAEPSGTHWWHGHAGFHRGDGSAGGLIVRTTNESNPHRDLYDIDSNDHVIILNDWLHRTTLEKYVLHHHSDGTNKGEGMLINGRGSQIKFTNKDGSFQYTPMSEFIVKKNLRYRFRVISNAVVFCPMEISIDGHDLTIISSDGKDVKPVTVSNLTLHGGERFDFVLQANQEPNLYWIRVQGMADCVNSSQKALLRYSTSLSENVSSVTQSSTLNLNPLHHTANNNSIFINSLRSKQKINSNLKGKPDKVLYFGFDFKKVNNDVFHREEFYPIKALPRNHHLYSPQINNVTFESPDRPLLYQLDTFDSSRLCDPTEDATVIEKGEFRSCVHLVKVPKNQLIEMVLFDEGYTFNAGHPMHLHGQHFAVVAQDRVGINLSLHQMKSIYESGNIKYELDEPPMKDTVIVPDGGYTIIRFRSDNPGFWAFHCHLSFHLEAGMMLVVQVGDVEDMKSPPPNYPTCGGWKSYSPNSFSRITPKYFLYILVSAIYPLFLK